MLDPEEIRWVKSTANELNNLLQVISESSQMLEKLCEGTADTDKYFGMMQSAVDRAAKVTRLMVDRVGGYSAEALEALGRYLDDAALAGLDQVTVIHGLGTGALRDAVRAAAADHPLVTSVRPGERGEGGDGASIIRL